MQLLTLSTTCLIAYLCTVPWVTAWVATYNGHDVSRIAQIGLMVTCTLSLIAASPAMRPTRRWAAYLGIVLLLAGASIAHASVPRAALFETALWGGMVAMAAVVTTNKHPSVERWLAWAVITASALYALLEYSMVIVGLGAGIPPRPGILAQGYISYRFFNHVQTASLPLVALAMSVLPTTRVVRCLGWFALGAGFSLAIFEQARGTLLGISLASGMALWLARAAAWPLVRRLCVGALWGTILSITLFSWIPAYLQLDTPAQTASLLQELGSDHARFYLWHIALADIAQSPWRGIGPMHYAHEWNLKAAHPHNIYLQIAAEWGLPMLVTVLGGVLVLLARLIARLRSIPFGHAAMTGAGLLITCLAVLADGMVSGNFVMPVSQVWIAVAAGWSVRWIKVNDAAPKAALSNFSGTVLATALALGMIWLLLNAYADFEQLPQILNSSTSIVTNLRPAPRFWSAEWF